MRVAIASGKGGTGKTTVAANLARVAARRRLNVQLLDCDVEEPDCALFLRPRVRSRPFVEVPVPVVDEAACTHCGICADVCAFKAIVSLPSTVLVFPELCHACGACAVLCPQDAITEESRRTGQLEIGEANGISMVTGVLDVGEAKSPPVIRAVKERLDPQADLVIIDAPPGTSCPVIESVRDADLVVLVTEPTPFGLHDLRLAVEMVRALELPCVIVVNRSDVGDGALAEYCRQEDLPVVMEIPYDRALAESYARGALAVDALSGYRDLFDGLLDRFDGIVSGSRGDPQAPADHAEVSR
ncbi:MAG: ATP-binding protein [Actinobacteria bacterium]|nr:ATP-binding protein [Actinomycetota bacterium]